jgi:hypothetical protein
LISLVVKTMAYVLFGQLGARPGCRFFCDARSTHAIYGWNPSYIYIHGDSDGGSSNAST